MVLISPVLYLRQGDGSVGLGSRDERGHVRTARAEPSLTSAPLMTELNK